MEAVPRMPMIWLELKEAGEFQFSPTVRQVRIRVTLIQPVTQQWSDPFLSDQIIPVMHYRLISVT